MQNVSQNVGFRARFPLTSHLRHFWLSLIEGAANLYAGLREGRDLWLKYGALSDEDGAKARRVFDGKGN